MSAIQRVAVPLITLASGAQTATFKWTFNASNSPVSDTPVGPFTELALDLNITAGANASNTAQLKVNRKGTDGIYYNIYTGSAITSNTSSSVNLGVGASTNVSFGRIIEVQTVIVGAYSSTLAAGATAGGTTIRLTADAGNVGTVVVLIDSEVVTLDATTRTTPNYTYTLAASGTLASNHSNGAAVVSALVMSGSLIGK